MKYYFRYGTLIQERFGLPALGYIEREKDFGVSGLPSKLTYSADFIFYFRGNKTEYLKDRYYVNAQYTQEEQLVIALTAAPLSRKS
jgi:hypothetical protein